MRRHALVLTAAGFALSCVLASMALAGPSPTAPSPTSRPFAPPTPVLPDGLGVNIHFTDPRPGEMKVLAAGGFTWVRMDFSWEGTEHRKGEFDFGPYDRLMKALGEHHVRPVFILDYKNKLYDEGLSPHTDEGRTAFAKWAAAAAVHFKNGGVIWEMYNEPNIGFWKPKPSADDYAKLALAVGKALREAAPDETYVGPATSTIDFKFLEACFKAGCLEYWSAVSVHPYRQTDPETAIEEYRRLRLLIAKYGPNNKRIPILSGEWGYSSAWKNFDEDRQGKYLPRQWLINVSNDVPLSIWYDWRDDGTNPKEPEHHFGTVANAYHAPDAGHETVYEVKPAYVAAKTLTSALAGYRFNKRLIVGDDKQDFVLLFNKEGDVKQVKLAVWTTAHEAHKLTIPTSPGVFHVTDYLGKPLADATAGEKEGLSVSAADGVQYLQPEKPNDLLSLAAAWDRAPLEVVATGGREAHVSLGFSNPLDEAVSVATGVADPLASLRSYFHVGPHEAVREGAAGQTWTPAPADAPAPIRFSLTEQRTEGTGGFVQEVAVVVTNPLRFVPLPVADRTLPVRIENPSATPFRGRLAVTGLPGSGEGQVFELARGQKEVTLRFPCKVAAGAGYHVGFHVAGVDAEKVRPAWELDIPPVHYQPLEDFGAAAAAGLDKSWKLVADGDVEIGAKLHLSAEAPPGGPPAPGVGVLKLQYHFEPGWKFMRLAPQGKAAAKVEGKPKQLGLWVYGDGQGNVARLRFTDATGQAFQPDARVGSAGQPSAKVDWTGWRYVIFPLDGANTHHWGGAEDGVLHYPIHFDTLFLLDSPERQETEGAVYLAAPMLVEP